MKHANALLAAALLATLAGAVWWVAKDGAAAAQAAQTGNTVAFRGVRVFDGEAVIERANVVVRDGRIAAVGVNARIPDDATVIDGHGKTLLPGLIDAHTHSYGDARQDALRFGVTTEIDLMGDARRLPELKREREGHARTDRADVYGAGFSVTVPGGHGTEYGLAVPTLKTDDDAGAFVQARVAEGSDVIKLMVDDLHAYGAPQRMPTLSRRQQQPALRAAKASGRRSFVHIAAQDDALAAVEDGADGLAHLFVDAVASDAFIAAAKARGTVVVPTLSVLASLQKAGEGPALVADTRLRPRLSPSQVSTLEQSFAFGSARLPALDRALQSVRRLHAAGVPLLVGTDAGNPGTAHGASVHGELALFVRAGVSPLAALRAATSRTADFLDLKDRGRIAPGLRADLLLVDGDPTSDITATRAIAGVWKNGYRLAAERASQAAPAPRLADDARVISDFEVDLSSRFGAGWQAGGDRFMGGRSDAAQARSATGANGSRGALEIRGEVRQGTPYPWAGSTFSPGAQAMQPVDMQARQAITFAVRGTPGEYALVILSGADGAMPVLYPFNVSSEWKTERIALADIAGADWARVRGIGWISRVPGRFTLQLDDVALE